MLAIGLAVAAAFYSGTMLNHDTSWYLIATGWWIDGAELYRDVSEVNPPLAFYMTVPVVLVSHVTGLAAETCYVLSMMAVAAASLFWFRRLLRLSPGLSDSRRSILLGAGFAAACLMPIGSFGQREHLVFLLILPYIALAVFKPHTTTAEQIAVGVIAALGLALKPHFLVLPGLFALAAIIRQRRVLAAFTPEHLAMGATCLGYAVFVAVVHPLYLTEVVPTALLVYGAVGTSVKNLVSVPGYLVAACLVIVGRSLPTDGDRRVSIGLFLATLGCVVGYIAQGKGWQYHRTPIYSCLCLQCAWVGSAVLTDKTRRKVERMRTGSLVLICVRLPGMATRRGAIP